MVLGIIGLLCAFGVAASPARAEWGWGYHPWGPHYYLPYGGYYPYPDYFDDDDDDAVVIAPEVVYPPPVVLAPPPVVNQNIVVNPASPPYTASNGRYCREYQHSGVVGQHAGQLYGTACMQPDGSWRIVQ